MIMMIICFLMIICAARCHTLLRWFGETLLTWEWHMLWLEIPFTWWPITFLQEIFADYIVTMSFLQVSYLFFQVRRTCDTLLALCNNVSSSNRTFVIDPSWQVSTPVAISIRNDKCKDIVHSRHQTRLICKLYSCKNLIIFIHRIYVQICSVFINCAFLFQIVLLRVLYSNLHTE